MPFSSEDTTIFLLLSEDLLETRSSLPNGEIQIDLICEITAGLCKYGTPNRKYSMIIYMYF